MDKLDIRSTLPKYHRLKQILRRDILLGKYKPNNLIPSENELQEKYGVSITTVRRALSDLVHEKLLYREQGVGTFVKTHLIERSLKKILSFTNNMLEMGYHPSSKIIKKLIMPSPKEVAINLSIPEGTPLLLLQRLRYGDDIPMKYETTYILDELCSNITDKDLTGSLYQVFQNEYGHKLSRAQQTICFSNPDQSVLEYFDISEEDIPFFYVEGITYQETGIPILYEQSYYRGDLYKYKIDIINEQVPLYKKQ